VSFDRNAGERKRSGRARNQDAFLTHYFKPGSHAHWDEKGEAEREGDLCVVMKPRGERKWPMSGRSPGDVRDPQQKAG